MTNNGIPDYTQYPFEKQPLITSFLLAVLLAAIGGCANQVAPKGGPKDKEPPQPTTYTPPNKTTRFKAKQIEVEFNEFIKLQSASQNTYISPPLKSDPDISYKKRKLQIQLNDTLKPNTTYIIHMNDVVADITENNVRPDVEYVFSTGEYIDSFRIQGSVVKVPELTTEQGVYVLLYKDFTDSSFYNTKPYYFGRTDKQGRFSIDHIKTGKYRLFALKDINGNLYYDLPNEAIAFLDSPVYVDDTTGQYQLHLFSEDNLPLRLAKYDGEWPGKVTFYFNKPAENIQVKRLYPPENKAFKELFEYNESRDTITYWTNREKLDSLVFHLYNKAFSDTVEVSISKPGKFERKPSEKLHLKSNLTNKKRLDLNQPFTLLSSTPLIKTSTKEVKLFKDSLLVNDSVSTRFSEKNPRQLYFDLSFKGGEKYQLLVPGGVFKDIYGKTNDTIKYSFTPFKKSDYGKLVFTASDSTLKDNNYILKLFIKQGKRQQKQVKKIVIRSDTTVALPYLMPASYSLKIIEDNNRNDQWDTGDYSKKKQPEPLFEYPKTINLKANWSVEVTLSDILSGNRKEQ